MKVLTKGQMEALLEAANYYRWLYPNAEWMPALKIAIEKLEDGVEKRNIHNENRVERFRTRLQASKEITNG